MTTLHEQIMASVTAQRVTALTATGTTINSYGAEIARIQAMAGQAVLERDKAIVAVMAAPIKNQISINTFAKANMDLAKSSTTPREQAIEKHNSGDYSTESYTGNKNIMVGGYDARETLAPPEAYRAPSYTDTNISRVFISPPGAGSAGIPAPAPTPPQIRKLHNKGWNTWARSINKLESNSCCRFSVPSGSEGAFIGIGGKGLESAGLNQFSHALVSDLRGIRILENGIAIQELAAFQDSSSKLRIQRQGTAIIYVLTTGTATTVSVSSATYPASREVYIYGKLHSSGDSITEPEFLSGEVLFGSC